MKVEPMFLLGVKCVKGSFHCVHLNEVKTILTYYAIIPAHIHTSTQYAHIMRNALQIIHWLKNRNTEWITVKVKKMVVTCLNGSIQQYQKLFTQLLKRFNLLTYSNVNEFHAQARRRVWVCACAHSIRSSLLVLSSCMPLTHTLFFIHHPSSPFTST